MCFDGSGIGIVVLTGDESFLCLGTACHGLFWLVVVLLHPP